ncbi:MAG: trypsin-like peptidase domain-containing protein [Patescibacteria group bacterium]|nr:trypsin-like peptidase domain-containing protein [Patescibacteria group bacterium]MCL5224347.1 trypsin-like peptidase domain-containing protein [Patescibacteria group bacterium]
MDKKILLSVFVSGLVGVLVGGAITIAVIAPGGLNSLLPAGVSKLNNNNNTSSSTPYSANTDYEQAVISVAKDLTPSVVSVVISKNLPVIEQCPYNPFADLPPQFQNLFGGGSQYYTNCQNGTSLQQVGSGSGFVISSDGYILTNKHVVEDSSAQYTVLTNDGKKYAAKVVAEDPTQDIAIIKINATNLTPVNLGDSNSVQLGETSIAIGNALGEYRNTVSVGTISGLSRTITAGDQMTSSSETLTNVIQTTSAINPGNSGGPLLNLKGQVIGIDTAVDTGAQSVGFAIPINDAKKDIASVLATGTIETPYLGVRYVPVTPALVTADNLAVDHGALIEGDANGDPAVMSNSPAQKAGLQLGDVIISVNGISIDDQNNTLSALIESHNVGDTVTLQVQRGKNVLTVKVTLAKYPSS